MPVVGEAVARRARSLDTRLSTEARAWVVWACFALLVVIVELDSVHSFGNVFAIYREAGLRWRDGRDLYPAEYAFNYFPPSAVFLTGWSWLPFQVGGALWRVANLALFAFGLWKVSQTCGRPLSSTHFLIATVVTVLLSGSAARYGQMTLAMSGLMMASVAYAEGDALWRAAVCAALAVALKPFAVVLVLLLVAIYPRLPWRMAAALAVFFLLPFLFQEYHVYERYGMLLFLLMAAAFSVPDPDQTEPQIAAARTGPTLWGAYQAARKKA